MAAARGPWGPAPRETLPAPLLRYRVTCEGLWRMGRCAVVGAQIAYAYKASPLDNDTPQAEWDVMHEWAAGRLVELAEANGAMYVKAGQGFSQMSHLLPRTYCRVMRSLEDCVAFRPISEIYAVIERDLGKSVDELFESFDEQPLAAASLAQVHRARLRGCGREVAVKVQYIDVADRFDGDLFAIRTCLKVCGVLFPGYDWGPLVQRSDHTLRAELDFAAEARNADRCGVEMRARFGDAVTTPTVVHELSTPRVMMTDFIKGCKITDRAGIEAMGLSVTAAAEQFVEAMAYQIFRTGFVHADPHGGNVFVRPRPGKPSQPQVVLLDHGLYTTLTEADTKLLSTVYTAAVRREDDRLKACCEQMGVDANVFNVLASMFLFFPYDVFSPFKFRASEEELHRMRYEAAKEMNKYTELLNVMPIEYGLVLRNMNTVRAVVKDLGNPVRRSAIMLRYSIVTSDAHLSWFAMQWTLLKLAALEWYNGMLLAFARWQDPALFEAAEDSMLTLG